MISDSLNYVPLDLRRIDPVLLNNATVELMAGPAEDKGQDVQDIVVVGLSTANSNQGGFSYDFHAAMPAGLYHVRMNGTIWNGATQIGTTTALSNTINFTGITLDPCHPITWAPVRSLTDPGYTPLRITSPVGGSLIVPTEADGAIIGTLTKVDVTFDAENMNQTMEMVNTQTGFSAGVQTIMRTNFTSPDPHNPGPFVVYSDEVFIVDASYKPCPPNSTSSASGPGGTSAPSGSGPPGSGPSGKSAGRRLTIPMLLSLLVSAAASQYELAAQHLTDLRTDPMYFAETIQSYYDHRIETVLGGVQPSLVQGRAISPMLTDAYSFLAFYHVAKELIDNFRVVQARFPHGPARAHDLPQEYEDALRRLHPVLGLLEDRISRTHHQTMCSSAVVYSGEFDGLGCRIRQAQDGEDQTHFWQLGRVFDHLDRTTQDPAKHRRISALIASLLSRWGIVNDCPSPAAAAEVGAATSAHLSGLGPQPQLAARAFPVSNFTYPKGPRDAAWADCRPRAGWGKVLFALGKQVVAPFIVTSMDWTGLVAPKVQQVREKPTPAADQDKDVRGGLASD
ncbi:hypothetical protein B0H13DRAFT_2364513 [Mycena leptocephala]|nr:hypothetical protein B0H13DRAFT_2364513 [Mycena leptocephala]